jgi:MFS family permease
MASNDQSADFKDWKRNFLLLTLDVAFFSSAVSFTDASIISVFILEATGSVFLVGLLQMLRTAVFFIPQILSVNISGRKNRITILKWTTFGRSCLIIASLATLLTNDLETVTGFFFISLTLFNLCDGFTVVPWLELIAKSFPSSKRGSFFGVSGFVGGISQVAAGLFISEILGSSDLVFPRNYGILVLIELVIMLCGLPAVFLVKEKEDDDDDGKKEKNSLMTIIGKIPNMMREDKTVATLVLAQILISFYSLATPFYSVYALSKLDLKESIVGYFLSAQMFGRLASSFIWVRLCDRGRLRQIIQYTSIMYLTSLSIMLILGISLMPKELVEYGVIAAFILTGAALNGIWIGLNNYVMETTRADGRPILLGFLNSLNIMTSILPLLGGLMLGYLAYEAVFLTAVIPLSFSLIMVRNLKTKKLASN